MMHVGALTCIFELDCAHVVIRIQVQDGVFVQIIGFNNVSLSELDIQGVGVREILRLHGLKPRSKNASCTVSRSGSNTT